MKKIFYFVGLFIFVFSFFYSLLCTAQILNEIRNLRAGKHQNFYRVVLETSMKVDTKIELKTLPYRAIIKIPESVWRASNIPRKGNFYPNIPIIYSFKNDEIGKTNLTLNIEKPFSLDKVYWLSSPNGNKRLVIDLYFSSETDFIVTKKSFESFSKEEFESVLGQRPISEDKELELFEGQNKNELKTVKVMIFLPYRRSIARIVLAFEFWAIGPRCRSNCLHFSAIFRAPVRVLEARSRCFSSFA